MKSAYELAMERLEKQSPSARLTERQRNEIAEIDKLFRAKIAEKELFLKDEIAKAEAARKFDEVLELEQQLIREIRRLNGDCEEKKEKVRGKK